MNVDSTTQSFSRGIIRYRWPLLALITLITVGLIYLSQFQSMILASLIVLALVSLTQHSFRRGLISLASVLVPMIFIMGLMMIQSPPKSLDNNGGFGLNCTERSV